MGRAHSFSAIVSQQPPLLTASLQSRVSKKHGEYQGRYLTESMRFELGFDEEKTFLGQRKREKEFHIFDGIQGRSSASRVQNLCSIGNVAGN